MLLRTSCFLSFLYIVSCALVVHYPPEIAGSYPCPMYKMQGSPRDVAPITSRGTILVPENLVFGKIVFAVTPPLHIEEISRQAQAMGAAAVVFGLSESKEVLIDSLNILNIFLQRLLEDMITMFVMLLTHMISTSQFVVFHGLMLLSNLTTLLMNPSLHLPKVQ